MKLEYTASLMAEVGREANPGPVFDEFYEEHPLKIPASTSDIEQTEANERKKYITTLNSHG